MAADGVVLGPALLSSSLPALSDSAHDSSAGRRATGQHVHGASLLAALTVLGAAPASPRDRVVARVYTGPKGSRWRCATACSSTSATPRAPREVALARAGARRPELGGRLLRRRAPARTARRGLLRRQSLLRNSEYRPTGPNRGAPESDSRGDSPPNSTAGLDGAHASGTASARVRTAAGDHRRRILERLRLPKRRSTLGESPRGRPKHLPRATPAAEHPQRRPAAPDGCTRLEPETLNLNLRLMALARAILRWWSRVPAICNECCEIGRCR